VVEQVFFDGSAVEPGDRAQPARDSRPRPAAVLHVPAVTLDVGAARGEQVQPVRGTPAQVLAQIQR
jgi:hypothetical protein